MPRDAISTPAVAGPPDGERRFEAPAFYDLEESLRFVPMGAFDPACRRALRALWKAGRTPKGPVTLELRQDRSEIVARAFGPGTEWALDRVDALLGLRDEPAAFRPATGIPRLDTLVRRGRGLRLPRSPFVFAGLTEVILQQRIAWRDATRAHRRLIEAFGEPAPGPGSLKLPLSPRQWSRLTSHDFFRAGVDGQRARALRAAARQALTVDGAFDLPFAEAEARLAAITGCGPWTVGMTLGYVLGEPDAAIPGDLHLPHLVAWALAGEAEGDDARMLALLEPYRGHRFRLVRLLYAAGLGASITSRARTARHPAKAICPSR